MVSPPESGVRGKELRRIRRVLYFYYSKANTPRGKIREYESRDLTISLAARLSLLALSPPLIYLCGADFHTHPAAPRKYVVYVNFYLSYLCIASPIWGSPNKRSKRTRAYIFLFSARFAAFILYSSACCFPICSDVAFRVDVFIVFVF